MRDDLHRTVPLPRSWRPVLKYVSREADWERLPQAMSLAIRAGVESGLGKKWASAFKDGLASAGDDMFGFDRQARVFNEFERSNPTPMERRFCEVARGIYARDGSSDQLFERALGEICRQVTKTNIEHVTSQVRNRHGSWVAMQVHERLSDLSTQCLFEPKKPSRRRTKQEGVLDLLNTTIRIKI
ncbi:MAG: hypothetical protein JWR22_3127 [Herminiimonas sp.]|nr:hypothetical protein [Herminiimonas sp.]